MGRVFTEKVVERMQYPSPNQPAAVKLINRAGRVFSKLGLSMPQLVPTKRLIDLSIKNTGLNDFGDESFFLALEKLAQALENEANLSQIGRITAHRLLLDGLILRLKLTDYRKHRPEISEQKIVRPLFVVGLPRTGTTILYELLSQDPAHRAPSSWEVAQPVPPARRETFYTDPRIAEVDKDVSKIEMLAPGFQAIHAMGATLPQECVALLAPHFISDQFGVSFYIPEYRHWTLKEDMTPSYQWHYKFLQHLQVDYMERRWVLKTPSHLAYLNALIKQYPDAAIIQTHRAPMEVLGSISSLSCTLHSAFSDHIDVIATGQAEVDYFSEMLRMGMEQRAAMLDEDSRFFDVQFEDIISNPIRIIEDLYEHFGFEFSDEVRRSMQKYLDKRPRDKHGEHKYTLEKFGISEQQHGSLFTDYSNRFGFESTS